MTEANQIVEDLTPEIAENFFKKDGRVSAKGYAAGVIESKYDIETQCTTELWFQGGVYHVRCVRTVNGRPVCIEYTTAFSVKDAEKLFNKFPGKIVTKPTETFLVELEKADREETVSLLRKIATKIKKSKDGSQILRDKDGKTLGFWSF